MNMCVWHSENHPSDTCRQTGVDLLIYRLICVGSQRDANQTAAHLHRRAGDTLCAHLSIYTLWTAHKGSQHKFFFLKKDLQAHKHTDVLKIYAPTQRLTKYTSGSIIPSLLNWAVAEFHHHRRHSQSSETFLQRNFPADNWSARWNLLKPSLGILLRSLKRLTRCVPDRFPTVTLRENGALILHVVR